MTRAPAKKRRPARAARKASAATAPRLAELQALFQAAILEGGDDVLRFVPPNSRTDAGVLFGVYRNAYVGRLVDIVAADHPLTARYLGRERFDALARAYIAAHPSRTQNARWVSQHLPAFTQSAHPENPLLADLIAIEAAMNTAFDAADADVLDIATLGQVSPDQWDRLVFTPHPSAQHLTLRSNAFDVWLALKDDTPPPAPQPGSVAVLVWRQQAVPMLRPLVPEEAMMWNEAAKGVRFGVLCEMLATYDDPDMAALRAAQYLQGWLVFGMLTAARVEPPAKHSRRRDRLPAGIE